MLCKNTVSASTLELLISLQSKPYLQDFHLAGGTALALYLGHRTSIDIDLFTNTTFDEEKMLEQISNDYPLQILFTSRGTIKGIINEVNVDIIAHQYALIDEPVFDKGIRLLSMTDILAMKLNAISISGQRSKDFVDIFYCLENYSIEDMISFYQKKYQQKGDMHVLKSLIYFSEIDLADWPVMIKDPKLKWETVKKKLEKEVLRYLKNSG